MVFFLLYGLGLSAQTFDPYPWCPAGATWVYRYARLGGNFAYTFQYTKDTTVLGKSAKKLEVEHIECDSRNYDECYTNYRNKLDTPVIMYESGDTVYWLDDGQFVFLYNFGAQVGDQHRLSNSWNKCLDGNLNYDFTDTLEVGGLSSDTISNIIYPKYQYKDAYNKRSGIYGWVRRNIGGLSTLFPIPNPQQDTTWYNCNGYYQTHYGIWNGLMCYTDLFRGDVSPYDSISTWGGICHNILTGLEDYVWEKQQSRYLTLYPNPTAADKVHIQTHEDIKSYEIYDVEARLIAQGELKVNNTLYLPELSAGLYFLKLTTRQNEVYAAKLVKQ